MRHLRIPQSSSTAERLLTTCTVHDGSGCWISTRSTERGGYARITVAGVRALVHRVAYELWVGPIPEGLTIDHVAERGCISRACFNPDHLEAVTLRTNILRGGNAAAQHARQSLCKRGHPFDYISPSGRRDCNACRRDRRA